MDMTPGARLKAARLTQRLSLAEVSSRMHLSIAIVLQMESDDAHQSECAFLRGYLKTYARILDIPYDDWPVIQGVSSAIVMSDPPTVSWLKQYGTHLLWVLSVTMVIAVTYLCVTPARPIVHHPVIREWPSVPVVPVSPTVDDHRVTIMLPPKAPVLIETVLPNADRTALTLHKNTVLPEHVAVVAPQTHMDRTLPPVHDNPAPLPAVSSETITVHTDPSDVSQWMNPDES
jgi:transcriptional regulator with XRE-family HTH domain